jgi:dephospho-CoA kinase
VIIGLTGAVAAGKSTVAAFLVRDGFDVIDVDVLVRGLPPDDDTLRRALDALTTLPVRARSTPAVVEPVVGEAP